MSKLSENFAEGTGGLSEAFAEGTGGLSEAFAEGTGGLSEAFAEGKAFIPFVTVGDPDIETTAAIVRELDAAGARIIELGIPFSDPTAEGPVIQDANIRALAGGVTTDDVFDMASQLNVSAKLVVMTYANVVFHYGVERFCERAAAAGISGLILPDVPFEEKAEFADICRAHGIDFISMIAPTSEDRIAMIAREAEGFIYLVSSLGVTGVRTDITTDLDAIVAKIREVSDVPIAIGFGISNAEQAAKMAQIADGVIVGSAIVRLIGEHGTSAPAVVGDFAREIVGAIQ